MYWVTFSCGQCFTAVFTVCGYKGPVYFTAYYTADSMGISVLGIEFVSVALVSYDS